MVDENLIPPATINLIIFRCEEGACYGLPCLGSRALFAKLSPTDLLRTHRTTKVTLKENMEACGIDTSFIERNEKILNSSSFESFVELHIEQGSVLDKLQIPVGVVTKIIGCRRIEAEIVGRTGHSGAQVREDRHDAVFAFADFTQRCDNAWAHWLKEKREYMTMTIGKVHTEESMEAFTRVPDKVRIARFLREQIICLCIMCLGWIFYSICIHLFVC
jgi:N-carbamoyl-L-amino-acid hydrolase